MFDVVEERAHRHADDFANCKQIGLGSTQQGATVSGTRVGPEQVKAFRLIAINGQGSYRAEQKKRAGINS